MIRICPTENLVLDANVIISAVLGTHTRNILEHPNFRSKINISSPAVILEEVEKKIPIIIALKKNM
ncbi:PIN domain-containing protein [Candidatus Synechococcus spongiarum]|uniref:PIN domain-containing protein n=1 Tax=Candidatus Synechococcus spongiarum TaxID=431041 RepID=UPI003B849BBF